MPGLTSTLDQAADEVLNLAAYLGKQRCDLGRKPQAQPAVERGDDKVLVGTVREVQPLPAEDERGEWRHWRGAAGVQLRGLADVVHTYVR